MKTGGLRHVGPVAQERRSSHARSRAGITRGRGIVTRLLTGALSLGVLCGGVVLTAPPAHAYASDLGGGKVTTMTYSWNFPATRAASGSSGSYDYLAYTPTGWEPQDNLPLYVVLHGCPGVDGQGAQAMMEATRLNALADRERFIVLYAANGARCWRASSPGRSNSIRGGGGDADIVAGMTRQTMTTFNVDPERVYIQGFSSGGSQASATLFAYPDLYAAGGTDVASGPNADITCNAMTDLQARNYAEATVEQMGVRARAIPLFAIGGDGVLGGQEDPVGWVDSSGTTAPKVSGCTRIAYLTALAVAELMKPGSTYKTSFVKTGQVTHAEDGTPVQGEPWKRQVALDPDGCPFAENWIVGTGHKWMGGSTDPAYAHWGINDPLAPSTGENSWAFYKQFTLHGGNVACGPGVPSGTRPHGSGHGRYHASVTASLLKAVGTAPDSYFQVAPVTAAVDSEAPKNAPKSSVDARSVVLSGVAEGIDATYGVSATQAAPSSDDRPVHEQMTSLPAAPTFNADLVYADARARWNDRDRCLVDGPLASASSTLLNAQLQPGGANDDGTGWHGGSSVGMDDYVSQPGTGTSTGTIELVRQESTERFSLNATATTQVTGINVGAALYVEVVSPASAQVVATGVPGTSVVAVNQPVLRTQGLTLVSGRTFTTTIDGGLLVRITPGHVAKKIASDGTTASAVGTLAHIEILDPTGTATLADLTFGDLAAAATVPAGGVACKSGGADFVTRPGAVPGTAATEPAFVSQSTRQRDAVKANHRSTDRDATSPMAAVLNHQAPFTALLLLGVAVLSGLGTLRRRTRATPARPLNG
jgi:poly(3-hydroxybutyrate) depolymerase